MHRRDANAELPVVGCQIVTEGTAQFGNVCHPAFAMPHFDVVISKWGMPPMCV